MTETEEENQMLKKRILELEARVLELEDEYEFATCEKCDTKLTKENTYDWGERERDVSNDKNLWCDGYCEKCSLYLNS